MIEIKKLNQLSSHNQIEDMKGSGNNPDNSRVPNILNY